MIHFWLTYPRFYDLIQVAATGGFLDKVAKSLSRMKHTRILDLGCGTGNLVPYMKPKQYFGGDINPKFIELARTKFPDYQFEVFNLLTDRFPKAKFDYVIMMNVLHHLTDREVLRAFQRLQNWNGSRDLIIVESRPRGVIGNVFEKLDVGENFRSFDDLRLLVAKKWRIAKQKIVRAPFGTYEYLITQCRPSVKKKK